MIDVGQVYHATLTIKNQAISPATITLTITLPDGTTVTPSAGPGAASGADWVIAYDYATTMAGLHKAAWQTTGPGTAAADAFNVRDYRAILSLAEAKTHLGVEPRHLDRRRRRAPQLPPGRHRSRRIQGRPVRPPHRHPAGQPAQSPAPSSSPSTPSSRVTSVTSVWTGGPSWTAAQLVTDTDAGTVDRPVRRHALLVRALGRRVRDRPGRRGRTVHPRRQGTAPPPVGHAARPAPGRRPSRRRARSPPASGWAFSIPNRVLELLADDMTPAI